MIGGKKSYADLDKVFDIFDCIAMWDAYKNYGVDRSQLNGVRAFYKDAKTQIDRQNM